MGCSLEHRFFFPGCAWLVVENVTIATTTAASITITTNNNNSSNTFRALSQWWTQF